MIWWEVEECYRGCWHRHIKHNITTDNNKQSQNNIILQLISGMIDLIYYWSGELFLSNNEMIIRQLLHGFELGDINFNKYP